MENQTVTGFGLTGDGKEAHLYLIKNRKGMAGVRVRFRGDACPAVR